MMERADDVREALVVAIAIKENIIFNQYLLKYNVSSERPFAKYACVVS